MARCSFDGSIRLVLVLGILAGCGDESLPPPGPPTTLAGTSTTSVTGVVGTTVDSLRVRVTDADGRGVPGVSVDFRVTVGNGSIAVPPPPADTVPPTALRSGTALISTTNFDGFATASWTLGTQAGSQAAAASVVGLTTIDFLADADPDVPAGWTFSGESGFIGIAGQVADGPARVRVVDQFNNGTPGVSVAWAALGAGTSVGAAASTTDSTGSASVNVTLGSTHGLYLYTAAPSGFAADTIAFLAVIGNSDPSGDAADPGGAGLVAHDVTFFGGTVVDSLLILYYRFGDIIAALPTTGGTPSNSVVGVVELDVDQDSTTGFQITRQCIGGSPLGFGVDAIFDLNPLSGLVGVLQNPPSGTIPVLVADSVAQADPCAGTVFVIGTVPIYTNNTITLVAPIGFFGDDGVFDLTSFMANGSTFGITDIVPDSLGQTFDLGPITTLSPGPRRATRWESPLRHLMGHVEFTGPVRARLEGLREMQLRNP